MNNKMMTHTYVFGQAGCAMEHWGRTLELELPQSLMDLEERSVQMDNHSQKHY